MTINLTLPLPFTLADVAEYMVEHFDVSPFEQYCSVTGRPYATIPDDELESVIRFLDNDDLESFCDDLFVRMIAGMRPCLNWSRIEPITIEFARHHDKPGLLSWLINRANERKPNADMTFNEMMTRNQHRIKVYAAIEEMLSTVDSFELTQLLLQADTIANLHLLNPSFGKLKTPLFDLDQITAENYSTLVGRVRKWVESVLELKDQTDRQALSDARAAATFGNRLTTMAYSRSWMENPVSALNADARSKREKKADGTWGKRVMRVTKKALKQAEVESLFASVEQMLATPAEPASPKVSLASKIAQVKPAGARRFGPGFKAKESGK